MPPTTSAPTAAKHEPTTIPRRLWRHFETWANGKQGSEYHRCTRCGATHVIYHGDALKPSEVAVLEEHLDGHRAAIRGFDESTEVRP